MKPRWLRHLGNLLERPLSSAIWFYLVWLSATIGREDWLLVTLGLLVIHLLAVDDIRVELATALPLVGAGVLLDSVLSYAGFFIFDGYLWVPPWLVALWLGFTLCLHRGMQYFAGRWLACVIFGGLGGASSYWTGMKLGAVSFGYGEFFSVTVLTLIWATLFPTLIIIGPRLRAWFAAKKTT